MPIIVEFAICFAVAFKRNTLDAFLIFHSSKFGEQMHLNNMKKMKQIKRFYDNIVETSYGVGIGSS